MYEYLLFVHENNILSKIEANHKGLRSVLKDFYETKYIPMRETVLSLRFDEDHLKNFGIAAKIFTDYYKDLIEFRKHFGINSQSKWDSSFLEEISNYLFKDVQEIANGEYGIFNKKIYAGLKINTDKQIEIITKDVDFCIGKMVEIKISDQPKERLLLPVVAVEVKTYLDATMFGEVKSSSKAIRSATPNSKTYVLAGYKSLADEHLIAARQDSTLQEIFFMQQDEGFPFDQNTIFTYWKEIVDTINAVSRDNSITVPGRTLRV